LLFDLREFSCLVEEFDSQTAHATAWWIANDCILLNWVWLEIKESLLLDRYQDLL
jgi:hypothetical protein